MPRLRRLPRGDYAWRTRPPSARAQADQRLLTRIRNLYAQSRGTYGAPRIHADLQELGVRCARKRVARLMRQAGLCGAHRRRRLRTPIRDRDAAPAPDLVARAFASERPNRLWIADLTYVRTWSIWLYLTVVLEMCSRRVVGWAMADTLESAQGGQDASLAFGRRCRDAGILPSMGRGGNAYDNALAEAFFATPEPELLTQRPFPHRGAARATLFDDLEEFYNPHRRHSALGDLSPAAYEWRWREGVRIA